MWWESGPVKQRSGGGSYGVLRVIRKAGDGSFDLGDNIFNRDGFWGWSKFRTFLNKNVLPRLGVFVIN